MHPAPLHNEHLILSQVAAGEEMAFSQLYTAYSQFIYSYVSRLTRSTDTAAEVTQDIFLKVWLNRQRLPQLSSFRDWLFIVARNHIFSRLKRMASEKERRKLLATVTDTTHVHPEALLIDKENQRLLEEAIYLLTPQQQLIFDLSRKQGLRYEQIAQQLNISRFTVKAHMQQALKTIRAYLQHPLTGYIVPIGISMGLFMPS